MNQMKKLTLLVLLNTLFTCAYSQVTEESITHLDQSMEILPDTAEREVRPYLYFQSRAMLGGTMLRWAPTTLELWLDGLDHGYILERRILSKDSNEVTDFEIVSGSAIMPWDASQWKSIVSDDKPYCAAAAQCVLKQTTEQGQGFVLQADEQQNLFGFNLLASDLDRDAAIGSGLGYFDISVDTSEIAIYRLRLASAPLSGYTDTASTMALGYDVGYFPTELDTILEYENKLKLQWSVVSNDDAPTAYYVERSVDGENFERLNKTPYIPIKTDVNRMSDQIVYIDSVPQNYTAYYYRVLGINAFAQTSKPSNVVKAMGQDRTPPNTPFNVTSQEAENGVVMINWDWEDYNKDNDLTGFRVLKSTNAKGPFDTLSTGLISEKKRKIMDKNPDQVATNFYKVIAYDDKGNYSESNLSFLITTDDVAPAAPQGLEAVIDSTGLVLLTWEPPADKDVRGYLVHFSNGEKSNFAVIPGQYLTQPFYLDSLNLNTLTESIYYYVVALDLSYNASEASQIIEAKKPDIIPPVASIFKGYKVDQGAINITWIKSVSADVERVELWRKTQTSDWIKMENFDDEIVSFKDNTVSEGEFYEYTLRTYDDAGNLALPQKNLSLKALKPFFIAGATETSFSKEKEGAMLAWQYENAKDFTFIIYKGTDTENLSIIKYVEGSLSFLDSSYSRKDKSMYAIKVRARDGRSSELTIIDL